MHSRVVAGGAVIVALVLGGCGGSSHSTTTQSSAPATPAVERNGKLAFAADPAGNLRYTVTTAIATAGRITISMTNASGGEHNVAIQTGTNGPVLGATPQASSGTASFKATLKAGTYTFFCQVPGHRESGMLGTLTVR
jgi:plastocyanin